MISSILIILFCYLSGWAFDSLAGFFEGYYYDMIPSEKGHRNLHPFYVIQRCIFWSGQILFIRYIMRDAHYWFLYAFAFGLASAFAYPFWHDGVEYATRNKLNSTIYKNKFWANKEPSVVPDPKRAKIEFPVKMRIILFAASLIFIAGFFFEIVNK